MSTVLIVVSIQYFHLTPPLGYQGKWSLWRKQEVSYLGFICEYCPISLFHFPLVELEFDLNEVSVRSNLFPACELPLMLSWKVFVSFVLSWLFLTASTIVLFGVLLSRMWSWTELTDIAGLTLLLLLNPFFLWGNDHEVRSAKTGLNLDLPYHSGTYLVHHFNGTEPCCVPLQWYRATLCTTNWHCAPWCTRGTYFFRSREHAQHC